MEDTRRIEKTGSGEASTAKRKMLEEEISENDFMELKAVVSKWFDEQGCINKLKVLYRDLINPAELYNAFSTIDLLNCLTVLDELNSTNLSLLYETINVTKHFSLVKKIKKTLPSCPVPENINNIEISKFKPHRLKLMKLGSSLTTEGVAKIDGLYNCALKKYADSWSLIMDLEQRCKIQEGKKIEVFVRKLKNLGLSTAVGALCEDNSSTSSDSEQENNEGARTDTEHMDSSSNLQHKEELRQDLIIKESLTKRQKELYQDVNRMTPAIWHKDHEVDIAEVFTELILLQSEKQDKRAKDDSTSIKRKGRPTSLPNILSLIKSKDSCKVLITGKGGMGKTTLLRYIAYQWATDCAHIAFANKLLFLINIRDIKENEMFLDMIMRKIDVKTLIHKHNLPSNSVETFLINHANEIVILLDGYDELKKDAKDPIELFERTELGESTVLVTSRPDNIVKLVKCCDIHIQVNGFSRKNIKKYISNHFRSISKVEMGCSLIKEFRLDYLKDESMDDDYYNNDNFSFYGGDHKEAFKLCSSPLLLLKICTIWGYKRFLPKNLSDLFKELFCCIFNQYQNRGGNKSSIDQFERSPNEYVLAIQILGECMYEGLKENKLSVDKYDLTRIANNEKLVHLALEVGFVYEDSPVHPGDVREIKTPPHKLISESLAGFYLSEQIQKENLKADEYEVVRTNRYLHMTRVFTVGFLGPDVTKLLKHWLVNRAPHFSSIAQCFIHVKEEYEHHVLQELNKLMSNEMKACCEKMCGLFRGDEYDVNGQLFKLMKIISIKCGIYNVREIEKTAIFLINRSSEESFLNSCKKFVLKSVVVQRMPTKDFLRYISNWNDEEFNILSVEMKNIDLTYNHTSIILDFEFNSSFLIHFLKNANELSDLSVGHLTSMVLNDVINELHISNVQLKLRKLDISHVDLHDVDETLPGKLLKVAPRLQYLDVSCCRLSSESVRVMLTECQTSATLKDIILELEENDLSALNGKSLVELVRVTDKSNFLWSSYSLTANNLESLVESIGQNETLNWKRVDLSKINLSSISGTKLACIFKFSPDLIHIDMSYCSLSSSIVNEMMEECGRMNVVLRDNMLRLEGNYLAAITFKSYLRLMRASNVFNNGCTFRYFNFTADNLKILVKSISQNKTLNWKYVDLSRTDLSSISGRTLACLFMYSPYLIHVDMRFCRLSGSIVNEMMEECARMNVVLKNNMLSLEKNKLSTINGKSLAGLIRASDMFINSTNLENYWKNYWKGYGFTASNIESLVKSIGQNETLNWKYVNLSSTDLSSISGTTLACLFRYSPNLIHIDMRNCRLSGIIVNEMMEECARMNVVLKKNMLSLEKNKLSAINGKSLAGLMRVSDVFMNGANWKSNGFTAGNLKSLIESVGQNETLNWKCADLSCNNLSSVSGRTLAYLLKFSPDLIHINLTFCCLSGAIVNEMMKECGRMNVVLKEDMLSLDRNDLTAINNESLAKLERVIRLPEGVKLPLKAKLLENLLFKTYSYHHCYSHRCHCCCHSCWKNCLFSKRCPRLLGG